MQGNLGMDFGVEEALQAYRRAWPVVRAAGILHIWSYWVRQELGRGGSTGTSGGRGPGPLLLHKMG